MSEQAEVVTVESKAPPEVQARAEKMGWIPPARFKGDAERFVDADLYIERGETVLPIVKEQNKRLAAEVSELRVAAEKNAAALAAAQKAIEDIEERHTVATQKAVEAARTDLKRQLAAASEAGDHEAVAELTGQMVDLGDAEKAAKAKAAEKLETKVEAYVPPPEMVEWNKENEWFGTNKRKTALFLGIAQELRDTGDKRLGTDFFNAVKAEMEKDLGAGQQRAAVDKVEGANHSGGESEIRNSGKKSYNNLSAEAKAACDADGKARIGEGKRYKTQADQRAAWSAIYFSQE